MRDRDPHQVHLVERDPERADRPLQDRGEGEVEGEAGLASAAGRPRAPRRTPCLGEVDVGPAGEAVLLVPVALAVAQQDELGHRPSRAAGRRPRRGQPARATIPAISSTLSDAPADEHPVDRRLGQELPDRAAVTLPP